MSLDSFKFPTECPHELQRQSFRRISAVYHRVCEMDVLDPQSKVILEINPLYGEFTQLLVSHFPSASVYCVDSWNTEAWTSEAVSNRLLRLQEESPLFPTFVRNLWEDKDRVVPMKVDLRTAIQCLKDEGKDVDFVFVNCRHPLTIDLRACLEDLLSMLPFCPIIGDSFRQVDEAVREISAKKVLPFHTHFSNNFWSFHLDTKGEGFVPNPSSFGAKLSDILQTMKRQPASTGSYSRQEEGVEGKEEEEERSSSKPSKKAESRSPSQEEGKKRRKRRESESTNSSDEEDES